MKALATITLIIGLLLSSSFHGNGSLTTIEHKLSTIELINTK